MLPAYINRQAQPSVLLAEDPRFIEVADYLRNVTAEASLKGTFDVREGELQIQGLESG